jgi:hypothetical protein
LQSVFIIVLLRTKIINGSLIFFSFLIFLNYGNLGRGLRKAIHHVL